MKKIIIILLQNILLLLTLMKYIYYIPTNNDLSYKIILYKYIYAIVVHCTSYYF